MNAEQLKGHLDLLLLSIIEPQPLHGYAIIDALRTRSAGLFDLPEGTVYPALHRLEDSGWLVSVWGSESGRRRRVYEITAEGRRSLAQRQNEWKKFAAGVTSIIGKPGLAGAL